MYAEETILTIDSVRSNYELIYDKKVNLFDRLNCENFLHLMLYCFWQPTTIIFFFFQILLIFVFTKMIHEK